MILFFKRIRSIVEAFSVRERITFWSALVVAIVGGITLLGFVWGNFTKIVPARGGSYTEGIVGQPTYVNPVIATSETDKELVRLLFANLKTLAEKIEASSDSRTWTVRLKENLRWSDRERLTSDDIVFTIEQIQSAETASPLFSAWQGVLPRRVSEQEIEFRLSVPYAFFAYNLERLYPIPKHIFGDVPSPNWKIAESRLKPVGSGPYTFEKYSITQNGFIRDYTLKANNDYAGGNPFIPKFSIVFFADKEGALAAFNLGHIDGIGNMEATDLLSVQRPYEVHSLALPGYYAIFINQNKNLAAKDLAVRTALSYAIDRTAIVSSTLGGYVSPLISLLPEEHNSSTTASFASLQIEAERILDEDGWKRGEDEVRRKEMRGGSISLTMTITTPETGALVGVANEVRNAWQSIGAEVTVKTVSLADIQEHDIKNRDYEFLLFGNILSPTLDLYPFWHSSERFYPGSNLALYSNKTVDALIESARQSADPETREKKLKEASAAIQNDVPAIFLFSPSYLYLSTKDLRGIGAATIAESADRFVDVASWHLKTARTLK